MFFLISFVSPDRLLAQSNEDLKRQAEEVKLEKDRLDNEKLKLDIEKLKLDIENSKTTNTITNESNRIKNRSNELKIIRENLLDPTTIKNPTIELKEGSTFKIEGETLAAESLGELVADLYQSLKSSRSLKTIDYLIMAGKDDISIQSLDYYNKFNDQIELFNEAYDFILDAHQIDSPPAEFSPTVFPLALQGILQTISAFRTDVKIQSIDVSLDNSVLVAQLAALFEKEQNKIPSIDPEISNPEISNPEVSDRTISNPITSSSCIPPKTGRTRIFYPNLFPIYLSQLEGKDKCTEIITKKLESISKKALQGKIIIQELESKQKELKENNSDLDQKDKEKLINLSMLDMKFNELVGSIYLLNSEGISNLSLLKTGLKIKQMLATPGGHLMLFQMTTGGSIRTTSNIFGTKVRYSGGASVSFFFFDEESSIIFSDALQHHTGFKKLDTGKTTSVRSLKN